MRGWLVDTGPLVAILDRDDPDHSRCARAFRQVRPPLLTTWPVITESLYLVAFSRRAQDGLLEMIQRGAVAIAPLTGQDVPRLRALMEKYRDTPMDFADATLVRVAERDGIENIFTLDRDFVVYRAGRGRTFSVRL
jgi:predicted nucleic acid-binding protein